MDTRTSTTIRLRNRACPIAVVNKIRIPRTRRARDEPELVEAKLQLLGLRVRRGGGQGIPLLGRGADERDGLGDDGSGGAWANAADERGSERYRRDRREDPRQYWRRCWGRRRTGRRRHFLRSRPLPVAAIHDVWSILSSALQTPPDWSTGQMHTMGRAGELRWASSPRPNSSFTGGRNFFSPPTSVLDSCNT